MEEPIKLGLLIAKLRKIDKDAYVHFDFCSFVPTTFDSYRGFYEQLALGYQEQGNMVSMKVGQLLVACEKANGETFTGYKGGEFRMNLDTPVWVSNYGHAEETAIVDVLDKESRAILITAYIEW